MKIFINFLNHLKKMFLTSIGSRTNEPFPWLAMICQLHHPEVQIDAIDCAIFVPS
jgi:hypothetical protein